MDQTESVPAVTCISIADTSSNTAKGLWVPSKASPTEKAFGKDPRRLTGAGSETLK